MEPSDWFSALDRTVVLMLMQCTSEGRSDAQMEGLQRLELVDRATSPSIMPQPSTLWPEHKALMTSNLNLTDVGTDWDWPCFLQVKHTLKVFNCLHPSESTIHNQELVKLSKCEVL